MSYFTSCLSEKDPETTLRAANVKGFSIFKELVSSFYSH